jgi:hypothetical protein
MASRFVDYLNTRGTYAVGNLNSWEMEQVNQGALVSEATGIENFTMVELFFEHEDPSDTTTPVVRKCKKLTDVTKPQYLIASIERRVFENDNILGLMQEELSDFYNAKGEQAAIYHVPVGKRIQVSKFALCAEAGKVVTAIVNGMGAYFDATLGKFVIVDLANAPTNYTSSSKKFVVVANGDEIATLCGQQLVGLEAIS